MPMLAVNGTTISSVDEGPRDGPAPAPDVDNAVLELHLAE
jgi:hypothetical protein